MKKKEMEGRTGYLASFPSPNTSHFLLKSVNKYLLSTFYVLVTVLSSGESAVIKSDKTVVPHGTFSNKCTFRNKLFHSFRM